MTPPAEPLRQLPFTARPFRRETIGSFLTRLASANRIRTAHMLQLTAISVREQREFTPATDDWLGWSPSTPHRIAALAGRPLAGLAAAFPAVAGFLAQPARPPVPEAGKIQRACRHCTAAQNITSMVIVQARPHDYLCVRHRLWHHGIRDIDLRPLPQVTDAQRRHDQHVRTLPASRRRARPPAGTQHHRRMDRLVMAPGPDRPVAAPAAPHRRRRRPASQPLAERRHPSRVPRRRQPCCSPPGSATSTPNARCHPVSASPTRHGQANHSPCPSLNSRKGNLYWEPAAAGSQSTCHPPRSPAADWPSSLRTDIGEPGAVSANLAHPLLSR